MNRFDETPFPAAPFDRDEDGYPCTPDCENCGRSGLRLTVTPTLYRACDDCMEECLAVIERKEKEAAEMRKPVMGERSKTQSEVA